MNHPNKQADRPGKKGGRLLGWAVFLLTSAVFTLSVGLYAAVKWTIAHFQVTLKELLFTLTASPEGANLSVVRDCVRDSLPALAVIAAYILAGAFLLRGDFLVSCKLHIRAWTRNWRFGLRPVLRLCMSLACAASLVFSLVYTDNNYHVRDYIKRVTARSTIYEDYYVDPNSVEIAGEGKNLIYIFMESMEATYASQEDGGTQEVNYIPNLTALARENISFSNSERLGGSRCIVTASWTLASLFAHSSGLAFSFPVDSEERMEFQESFAPGATCLGDILAARGYQNEFLCGSDSTYAGKRHLFQQHGYDVFDLNTAREAGYVPPDYHNGWWGIDDQLLYEIAKDELTAMAASGRPFNLTMLTVDTHYVDGWLCGLCGDEYDSVAANVVACADRQVMDFIGWCREQDFYEDTLIVIVGDHTRMDWALVEGIDHYYRPVYNCFLNSALPSGRTVNREFSALDMFPTVLTAMGFQIEGDRLGLGVNLSSDKPTLCEIMGYDALNEELAKYSSLFVNEIAT